MGIKKPRTGVTQKEKNKRYYENSFFHNEVIDDSIECLINLLILGDEEAVRGCLLTYPEINICEISEHYHFSPLYVALLNLIGKNGAEYRIHFNLLKDLLKMPGIHINTLDNSNRPILFVVTAMENLEVLDIFLQIPTLDVNRVDNLGNTVLHDAACRHSLPVVQRLLADTRIDSRIKNKNNETADQAFAIQYTTNRGVQAAEIITSIQMHQHELNQLNSYKIVK